MTHKPVRPFPVLLSVAAYQELSRLDMRIPTHVPWWVVEPHEKQAYKNHYQTLERLADRGGLSPAELVAVLEDREWTAMTLPQAVARLRVLVARECPITDDEESPSSRDPGEGGGSP